MSFESKSDTDLILNIQKYECNDSLQELIKRHTPVCYYIYKRFKPILINTGVSSTRDFDEKDYVIYQAAKAFKPEKKTKYVTCLSNYVRYYCLSEIKKKKKSVEIPFDKKDLEFIQEENRENDYNELNNNYYLIMSHIHDLISKTEDNKIKKIFQLRYSEGKKKSWSSIAEEVKLPIGRVMAMHQKTIEDIKNKLTLAVKNDMI